MQPRLPVNRSRGEAGASLVEVAVSLVLLSIALLGVAAAFPLSRAAIAVGSQASIAVGLARQTFEEMRNRRYTTTVDEITPAAFPSQGYGAIPDFPAFRRSISITDGVPEAACTPPPGTPCTKTVRVRVLFRDPDGQEQAVALTTIFIR